jgi:DnaJ family protein C protein 7
LLSEIIVKDQTNVDAIYVRGICLYYQDNTEKAFQHFQRVLQYSPDHEKAKSFYKVDNLNFVFLFETIILLCFFF